MLPLTMRLGHADGFMALSPKGFIRRAPFPTRGEAHGRDPEPSAFYANESRGKCTPAAKARGHDEACIKNRSRPRTATREFARIETEVENIRCGRRLLMFVWVGVVEISYFARMNIEYLSVLILNTLKLNW